MMGLPAPIDRNICKATPAPKEQVERLYDPEGQDVCCDILSPSYNRKLCPWHLSNIDEKTKPEQPQQLLASRCRSRDTSDFLLTKKASSTMPQDEGPNWLSNCSALKSHTSNTKWLSRSYLYTCVPTIINEKEAMNWRGSGKEMRGVRRRRWGGMM